jgi:hypothetical protein
MQPVVYGSDDRQEYFEVTDPHARAVIAQSVVALVSKARLGAATESFPAKTSTWGELEKLCPEERFRDQPAAAFCTGVLVDWDLVLTAGHCLRLFAVQDMAVVFDYFYEAPEKLAARKEDALAVVEIVAEALDPQGTEPRLDFGWLRLEAPVGANRQPVPVYLKSPALNLGDPIISMGAGGGVPIKFDAAGRVRQLRSALDYFIADVDSSHGWSGGGAFDDQFRLLGILSRGGEDFVDRSDGCRTTNVVSEEWAAEQFTYAHRAVAALCDKNPNASSLCRESCPEPCTALPRPVVVEGGGCSLAGSIGRSNSLAGAWFAWSLAMIVILRRRAY